MHVADQEDYFARLRELRSAGDAETFGESLRRAGFTPMRRFLDEFRHYLRTYEEADCDTAASLLARAMEAVPEPGRISPSWTYIWGEYGGIVRTKAEIFRDVPKRDREGEWQVLLDNPYSNQNIAVYPGLSFMEAAYMFAYFRTELANNEYIRLQKIATVITCTGADADGVRPIASL
ncbi:hypothetical protein [Paenibacillus glycinis]|uniref:Uncharacterized protein n=1 Tax=Paenibacillus glycinis TaxID=2697035 RepID=A0ABW9XLG2_9BACL|nr:hypothetical protein [Paenibacillus glycinis]NBD23435.1 hypothetical protein [Paenibacillus glycinis]